MLCFLYPLSHRMFGVLFLKNFLSNVPSLEAMTKITYGFCGLFSLLMDDLNNLVIIHSGVSLMRVYPRTLT